MTISGSQGDILKNSHLHNPSRIERDCALVMHASNDGYLVTRHDIVNKTMLDGQLISPKQAVDILSEKANLQKPVDFINERVLCDSDEYLIWHAIACKRSMFFSSRIKSRLLVNWPNLIYVASKKQRQLSVFATGTGTRPSLTTKVYIPPLQNIGDHGGLCIGSATFPTTVCQFTMAEVESCLMDSSFTHLSGSRRYSERLTHYTSDEKNYAFWQNKVNERVFASEMVAYGTLADVIKRFSRA